MTWEEEKKTQHHKIPELDKTLGGIGFNALYKVGGPFTPFVPSKHKFSFQAFQRKGALESPYLAPQSKQFWLLIALLARNFLIQSLYL